LLVGAFGLGFDARPMKRAKRQTKRERKAANPSAQAAAGPRHIHCIACGRHLEPTEFSLAPATATMITCQHGSQFPSCVSCAVQSQMLVDTHDRSGQPVKSAQAWH
jgi:hypothetical protein